MHDAPLKAREIEALAYVFDPAGNIRPLRHGPRPRRFGVRTSMIAVAAVVVAAAFVALRLLPG